MFAVLLIANIITFILIISVCFYIYVSINSINDELANMRKNMTELSRSLSNSVAEQEHVLSSSIAHQEQLATKLQRSVSNQASGMSHMVHEQAVLQEKMSKAVAEQEMLAESIKTAQEAQTKQEAMPPQQETQSGQAVQAAQAAQEDDVTKRANLMAIAYYNALRDKTPNEALQWDKINKHLYIVGFTNQIYKEGRLQVPVFTEITQMPYKGKYKASDVVEFIASYLVYYKPAMGNPSGLHPFELEKEQNNGNTMHYLASTFGILQPDTYFFPPPPPTAKPNIGIKFGSKDLFDIQTENGTARRMLDNAMKASY